MKRYFKAVLTGLVFFIFSFFTPNAILETIDNSQRWKNHQAGINLRKMYGGKE
jgi:hypothetical protein